LPVYENGLGVRLVPPLSEMKKGRHSIQGAIEDKRSSILRPVLAHGMTLVVAVWMLVAMVIAVRQALDYENTTRAVGVCAIGWVISLVVSSVLLGLLGGGPLSPPASP
jgi:hypothetical protein